MTLAQYVKRVMDEKGLNALEVERRSAKKVTDAHVKNIVKGKSKNPTLKVLLGLAEGLGVNPTDVFQAAASMAPEKAPDVLSTHLLARLMNQLVDNSDFARAVVALSKQKPAKIKQLLKSLEE